MMRVLTAAGLMLAMAIGSAHAMNAASGVNGRTTIQFQFDPANPSDSRFSAKIDVSAAIGQVIPMGSSSRNEGLALQTITLTIGSATFVAYADISGSTTEDVGGNPPQPFTSKLISNGKILQITATGWNLQELLPVNPAQSGSFSVEIAVSVTNTFTVYNPPTTVSLSAQNVTFNYVVKATKVQGKGF
jgi:hypothetical protein